jgi:hypothetical protein
MVVSDRIADRDGADHLTHLEFLQFSDGVVDAGNLLASLSNSPASMLQVLATDGAGKIIGQLLRHADGSDDLYTFEIADMTGGALAADQPVNSNYAFDNAGPDAAVHLLAI